LASKLKFNYAAKPFGAAQICRIFDDKFKAKNSLNLRGQLKAKAALAHWQSRFWINLNKKDNDEPTFR
jgi:hypothetical protein